jgi:hypothetical protein
MAASPIANLEKLLGTPRDGALLRYSLGCEYLKGGSARRSPRRGAPRKPRRPTAAESRPRARRATSRPKRR